MELTSIQQQIEQVCNQIKAILLKKNKAYGNSALDPVRIFSHSDNVEQIKVRIDDKLSRIARGQSLDEDVIIDLIGYFILLKIARDNEPRITNLGNLPSAIDVEHLRTPITDPMITPVPSPYAHQ